MHICSSSVWGCYSGLIPILSCQSKHVNKACWGACWPKLWEWERRGAGSGVHGYTNSCTALITRENDTVTTTRDQNQQMPWFFVVVSGRCAAEYRIHSCCSTDSSVLSLTFLGRIWIGLPDDRWILSSAVEHTATTTVQQQCDLWEVGKHFTWRIPTLADKGISHNVVRKALSWYLSEIKAPRTAEWQRYLYSSPAKRQCWPFRHCCCALSRKGSPSKLAQRPQVSLHCHKLQSCHLSPAVHNTCLQVIDCSLPLSDKLSGFRVITYCLLKGTELKWFLNSVRIKPVH